MRLRGIRPGADDDVRPDRDEVSDGGTESERGFPSELARDELAGLIRGPLLYGRSRWATRRLTRVARVQ
ncbi:hypothetical protein [Pseudonocardia sp. GCM10023141]|uniref:hypothetical protein n=1 Tax=Pseudonocardia sp. GCM10023141 TaxID=3252653 RepID=UPI00361BEC39